MTARLSFGQLMQLWVDNGGAPGWAPLMAGIAIAESSGSPTAAYDTTAHTGGRSRTTSPGKIGATGLWQIEWPLWGTLAGQVGGKTTRTALYTPATNAKVAIKLLATGKGISNWKGDLVYDAWTAAGSPPHPSVKEMQSILAAAHLSGFLTGGTAGGVYPGKTIAGLPSLSTLLNPPTNPTAKKKCPCAIPLPISFPGLSGCILSRCQLKALKGALAISAGMGIGITGFLVLAVAGFGSTKAGSALAKVGSFLPGPAGSAVRAVSPGAARSTARRTSARASLVSSRTRLASAQAKAKTRDEATALAAHSRESVVRQRAYDRAKTAPSLTRATAGTQTGRRSRPRPRPSATPTF